MDLKMDMSKITNNPATCKVKELLKSLSDLRIKKDYNVTVTLYDKNAPEVSECTHKLNGSSDHSLIKLLAVVGVVSVALSAICGVCSLFKD